MGAFIECALSFFQRVCFGRGLELLDKLIILRTVAINSSTCAKQY